MKPLIAVLLLAIASIVSAAERPLALHSENPQYFQFRGKPAIFVTSAEHYGAVLNREFDFIKYLDELATHGLNLTSVFTGIYCEDTRSFGITRNTLAPTEGNLICPWARSATPGYAGGGNKFDTRSSVKMKPVSPEPLIRTTAWRPGSFCWLAAVSSTTLTTHLPSVTKRVRFNIRTSRQELATWASESKSCGTAPKRFPTH